MNQELERWKKRLDGAAPALPASLEKDAVTALVEGEAQEKKKSNIRRYIPAIASAAAAVLLVSGALLARSAAKMPSSPDTPPARVQTAGEIKAETKASYADIAALVKRAQKENKGGYTSNYGMLDGDYVKNAGIYPEETVATEAAPTDPAAINGVFPEPEGNEAYSTLNTVVNGVDEADVIRTDGRYIYILKNGSSGGIGNFYGFCDLAAARGASAQSLIIVDPNGGQPQKRSETRLSLTQENASEIARDRSYTGFFLTGRYAVLTGVEVTFDGIRYNEEEKYWDFYGDFRTVRTGLVSVYDLSDPSSPVPVRDLYFDGTLLDTRLIDGRLVTVSRYVPDWDAVNYRDYTTFIPRAGDGYLKASEIEVTDEDYVQFVSVSVTDLTDPAFPTASAAVMGSGWDFYCSKENVYVYGEHGRMYENGDWANILSVHKVSVSGDTPVYVATADIENAYVTDAFSMDEYEGYLRLALEDYRDWTNRVSFVLVLDEEMRQVGRSEDFGAGENIRSVRFSGTLAYVVTFLNTDPLFAIDLSDPTSPTILGELKMPGYSAYLHPVGENLMVGVGYDGDEEGLNGNGKISLFDVSDPENPVEIDHLIVENGRIDENYKAFVPQGDNGFLVNLSLYDVDPDNFTAAVTDNRISSETPGETYSAGLLAFAVEDGKLAFRWCRIFGQNSSSLRNLYIGDVVYACVYAYDQGGFSYVLLTYDLENGTRLASLTL